MDDNNNENKGSSIIDIIRKFFKLPQPIRYTILVVAGWGAILFISVIGLLFVLSASASLGEEFNRMLSEAGENISEFWENTTNLFSLGGNYSDNEKATEAEVAYYKKLNEVYNKYKQKYNVEIDTTLITTTLFYNRMMGDYFEDAIPIEGEENAPNGENGNTFYRDTANFYKAAKGHIETLAKYQLVEFVSINGCAPESSSSSYSSNDKNAIAKIWDSLTGNFWSTQLTAYNQKMYEETITNNAGTTITISCDYEDLTTKLTNAYKTDKAAVDAAKDDYDSCMSCESSCNIYHESTNQYQECISRCPSSCSDEWDEYSKLDEYLAKDWYDAPNNYFLPDGTFLCNNEGGNYGSLSFYDDATQYRNYDLNSLFATSDAIAIKNRGISSIRRTLESKQCLNGKCQNTSCSRKPSIVYKYMVDTTEEGIYYWKLLSDMGNANEGVDIKGSFIKNYYFKDETANTEEEKANLEKRMYEVVDGIFSLYRTVAEERINSQQHVVVMGKYTVNTTADKFTSIFKYADNVEGSMGRDALKRIVGTDKFNLFWNSDNNRYFVGNNLAQCTGYSHGRALSILMETGMDLETAKNATWNSLSGNGQQWFASNGKTEAFKSSNNINEPKLGAVIVWRDIRSDVCDKINNEYIGCGHVAIVEGIQYSNDGSIESISISEGGTSNINGFLARTVPLSKIQNYNSNYVFTGYIYLIDY